MRAPNTLFAASCLAIAALSAPVELRAQSTGSGGQVQLPPGTYLPARDRAQLLDCYERALTIRLTLDSMQLAGLRSSIETFHSSTRPSWSELRRRTALRDSTVLALLLTATDSAQFRRNAAGERTWFESGNCNGKP